MKGKNWMSTSQVSEMVGVTAQTIRNYAAAGKIKSVKLPSGHRKFRRSDVLEFMGSLLY